MKIKTKQSNTEPSGIEWIGSIPHDWTVRPLKDLFYSKKEIVGDSSDDHTLLRLSIHGVSPKNNGDSGKNPEKYENYQIFNANELVFCAFDYDVTPRTIGYVSEPGMMTSAYTRLIPKSEFNVKYYYYYYLALDINKELLHLCTGLRSTLSKHILWKLQNPYPSVDTQNRIVDYLDNKISQIDQIIEKKQKLIELLKEKRISVITKAVTKGLDSKVKMKPSDVRWFDNIPHHWDIRKVKFLITDNDGGVWGEADDPDGQPVLRSTEITAMGKWRINEKEIAYRSLTESEISKGLLKENDLLVTKSSGSEEHIGKTAIVTAEIANKRYCYSNFMQRLRSNNLVNPKILYYFMNSYVAREQYNYLSNSTIGLGNLNADVLNSLYFLLIPPEEQEEIITYLDKAIEEIDLILDSFTKQIEKLREYRVSVIYGAVTGKIEI